LSVNINKVASLRNARHLGIPSVVNAARWCLLAGADGITVHPRPDERHIRSHDVHEVATLLKDWPHVEYNIEGNPFHNLMPSVRTVRPQQCTFVPDDENQFTSDHGWDLAVDGERLHPFINECRSLGVRVSLLMDPLPEAMPMVRQVGAERIELYTGPYAAAHGKPEQAEQLRQLTAAARAAQAQGLGVNAGHDLNRENLPDFLRAVLGVLEVSIGRRA
jgi:pyridoxine 5-phosphate synthase